MESRQGAEITGLLRSLSGRDRRAVDELVPHVYDSLRAIASRCLRNESRQVTLQPTALVHEAYLRLIGLKKIDWQDRQHFYSMAARFMRRILVEHARNRQRAKRGGQQLQVSLDEALSLSADRPVGVLALHEALSDLEKFDPCKAQILELRFFGGLSVEETAQAVGMSQATVYRHSSLAKSWLLRELTGPGHAG